MINRLTALIYTYIAFLLFSNSIRSSNKNTWIFKDHIETHFVFSQSLSEEDADRIKPVHRDHAGDVPVLRSVRLSDVLWYVTHTLLSHTPASSHTIHSLSVCVCVCQIMSRQSCFTPSRRSTSLTRCFCWCVWRCWRRWRWPFPSCCSPWVTHAVLHFECVWCVLLYSCPLSENVNVHQRVQLY